MNDVFGKICLRSARTHKILRTPVASVVSYMHALHACMHVATKCHTYKLVARKPMHGTRHAHNQSSPSSVVHFSRIDPWRRLGIQSGNRDVDGDDDDDDGDDVGTLLHETATHSELSYYTRYDRVVCMSMHISAHVLSHALAMSSTYKFFSIFFLP